METRPKQVVLRVPQRDWDKPPMHGTLELVTNMLAPGLARGGQWPWDVRTKGDTILVTPFPLRVTIVFTPNPISHDSIEVFDNKSPLIWKHLRYGATLTTRRVPKHASTRTRIEYFHLRGNPNSPINKILLSISP